MAKVNIINTVRIRCYIECKYNTFHKANCGYCVKHEISLTHEGCMDRIAPIESVPHRKAAHVIRGKENYEG